jgi:LuxR family maltose regulon positive regulatory protein
MRLVAQDSIGAFVDQYSSDLARSELLDRAQLKTLTELGTVRNLIGPANADLSKREMEVITALAAGGSDKEIARQLDISDHGVRYHLKNIFRKLGVHDRLAAVLAAKQKGWV